MSKTSCWHKKILRKARLLDEIQKQGSNLPPCLKKKKLKYQTKYVKA